MKRVNKNRKIEIIEIDGGVYARISQGKLEKGEVAYYDGGETFAEASMRALDGIFQDYLYKEGDEILTMFDQDYFERRGLYIDERIADNYNAETGLYYDAEGNSYDEPLYLVFSENEDAKYRLCQSEILCRVNDPYAWMDDLTDAFDDNEDVEEEFDEEDEVPGDEPFDVKMAEYAEKCRNVEEKLKNAIKENEHLSQLMEDDKKATDYLLGNLFSIYSLNINKIGKLFDEETDEFWEKEQEMLNQIVQAVKKYDGSVEFYKIFDNKLNTNQPKKPISKEELIKEVNKLKPTGNFKVHFKETKDIDFLATKVKNIEKAFTVLNMLTEQYDAQGKKCEVDKANIFLEEDGQRIYLYKRADGKEEIDLEGLFKFLNR